MRNRFDDDGNPDIKAVVAEYRAAMTKKLRWLVPAVGGGILLLALLSGTYTVEPGEVGVVRTFGQETKQTQPGLHFRLPVAQVIDIVNVAKVRRAEIGFRNTKAGPKRVDSEALMLTGDENIIEAQMIVQYQVSDPSKYLFRLQNPEKSLHIAAEVALRGVAGQTSITADVDSKAQKSSQSQVEVDAEDAAKKAAADAADKAEADAPADPSKKVAADDAAAKKAAAAKKKAAEDGPIDILTTGREIAQNKTKVVLQELMDLYESGLKITEVKLQVVDAPDEVKDAFHDVVRAREEREKKINKALGYREDRIPKARGEAQKIIRAAEAYKQERVLRAQGEAARYSALLAEYRKARAVTRERLQLETMERILSRVDKKVFIDKDVAKNALPLLPLNGGLGLTGQGGR